MIDNPNPEVADVVEQPEQEQQETTEQKPVEQPKESEESAQAKNFRQLREKAERIERERDEYARQIYQMQQASQPKPPQEPEDMPIGDNDIVEGKHLSHYARKMKRMEQQLRETESRLASAATEARLAATYPDFNKVVTKDNLESLSAQYPELAKSIGDSQDLYAKAVSAYTMIKKMGIVENEMYSVEREMAQRNANKPKPSAAISAQTGDSPLSRANAFAQGLTPDLQKQLYAEMLDAMKKA